MELTKEERKRRSARLNLLIISLLLISIGSFYMGYQIGFKEAEELWKPLYEYTQELFVDSTGMGNYCAKELNLTYEQLAYRYVTNYVDGVFRVKNEI